MTRARLLTAAGLLGLGLVFLAVLEFSWHSVSRGFGGLAGDAEAQDRLAGTRLSNLAIFSHMVTGGVITVLALVQWAHPIRRRWPHLHRMTGRVLAPLALMTGLGGLWYIGLRGTIGGPLMSVGFALYGLLMCVAAVETTRHAMAGQYTRHRRWATRLIILALGSWIYRVHYGIWYGVTCSMGESRCGTGSEPDFSGLFDQIQVFAFYLPYLLIAEVLMRRRAV